MLKDLGLSQSVARAETLETPLGAAACDILAGSCGLVGAARASRVVFCSSSGVVTF
jgi:3-hydroxyisobutyrate dehydrogenase-like beta-hydroxyacid dehydrogenase